MSTENTTQGQQSAANALSETVNAPFKKATKKAVKKAATKKAAPKKAAKKSVKKTSAKAKAERKPRGQSIRVRVFQLLAKNPEGLFGAEVMTKLGLKGIPAVLKHEAMRTDSAPRIKRNRMEGERGVRYILSAAGKKALEKGTVDSEAAPSSVGRSDLINQE